LEKVGVWTWCFDGENVVLCVVNVVGKRLFFSAVKIRQVFEDYFTVVPFWDTVPVSTQSRKADSSAAPDDKKNKQRQIRGFFASLRMTTDAGEDSNDYNCKDSNSRFLRCATG
jgi:hypothetical protein